MLTPCQFEAGLLGVLSQHPFGIPAMMPQDFVPSTEEHRIGRYCENHHPVRLQYPSGVLQHWHRFGHVFQDIKHHDRRRGTVFERPRLMQILLPNMFKPPLFGHFDGSLHQIIPVSFISEVLKLQQVTSRTNAAFNNDSIGSRVFF